MFYLHKLPKKTEWKYTLTNEQCMEQLKILPIQNVWTTQKNCQKSFQLLNAGMDKQSTHFNCITYPGKHNGTILLMYKVCTKQLERKQILENTTTVNLGIPTVKNAYCGLKWALNPGNFNAR